MGGNALILLPFHEFLSVAHFVSYPNQEMPSPLTLAASMVLLHSFTNSQFMLKGSELVLSKLQNMRELNLLLKQNHPQIKYFEVLIYYLLKSPLQKNASQAVDKSF